MQIELGKLNEQRIKGNEDSIKMGFSPKAHGMLFDMFTDTIYANPIGSIIREITSNCFDSHVEAKKDNPSNPVIIKHTYDRMTKERYLSFFDNGMGMSPVRIETIYGQYFESTKRDSNDEIGGFGIGGKSPMAYKRKIVDENGKTVEDSSFFVITRYNGIEYTYGIFKGAKSPEIKKMNECSTTLCNGTEIRIPILEKDLPKFIYEIKRQLYYFENIIFQGFDNDSELNNYKIYKGEHFLYRGDVYGDEVHLCIGKVAYPIKFSDMGLDRYNYRVPVALKFNIGDIDVVVNREDVRYTENTIAKIKEKLDLVKKELSVMLGKQFENVRTLKDYFQTKSNYNYLNFPDQKQLNLGNWIKKTDVVFVNFKYNGMPNVPNEEKLITMFYNTQAYGKKTYYDVFFGGNKPKNVLHCTGEFNRKIIKQAYLNYLHNKQYAILKPYFDVFTDAKKYENLCLAIGAIKDTNTGNWLTPNYVPVLPKVQADIFLEELQKDVIEWVEANTECYDTLEVPEEFIEARKRERLSAEILNVDIPLGDCAYYNNKRRVVIRNVVEFKGRIFYGVSDDVHLVKMGCDIYTSLFGSNHINRIGYGGKFDKGKGIAFVSVAKGNEKYLKMCPNVYHIDLLYPMMLRRKMINPLDIKLANEYKNKWKKVEESIYSNETFGIVNKVVAEYVQVIKKEIQELKEYEKYEYVDFNSVLIKKYFDPTKALKPNLVIKTERQMNYIHSVIEKNKELVEWINVPYNMRYIKLERKDYVGLVCLLNKVLVF